MDLSQSLNCWPIQLPVGKATVEGIKIACDGNGWHGYLSVLCIRSPAQLQEAARYVVPDDCKDAFLEFYRDDMWGPYFKRKMGLIVASKGCQWDISCDTNYNYSLLNIKLLVENEITSRLIYCGIPETNFPRLQIEINDPQRPQKSYTGQRMTNNCERIH